MNNIDILSIHSQIIQKFQEKEGDLVNTHLRLFHLKSLPKQHISNSVNKKLILQEQELEHEIRDTENKSSYHYYLLEAIPILDQYKKLKKEKTFRFNFLDNTMECTKELDEIIQKYMRLIRPLVSFISLDVPVQDGSVSKKASEVSVPSSCPECNSEHPFLSIDNNPTCSECGIVVSHTHNSISFKDINRVNIYNKYTYDRRTHFRDTINQFQGKQNAVIDPSLYTELIKRLVSYHLIPDDWEVLLHTIPREKVFEKVDKQHIMIFLKDMKQSKYYEDINLIYHQITHKPIPDISHLENTLMNDFDMLIDQYDKTIKSNQTSRKNFINTQYVLYQLLKRHKFPCRQDDFSMLKTIDRKYYHDEVCRKLFEELGWNHYSTF
jgi:hypothetical protein